ncbi:WRKY Transcription Factor [Ancistrocladus abbreviatus]
MENTHVMSYPFSSSTSTAYIDPSASNMAIYHHHHPSLPFNVSSINGSEFFKSKMEMDQFRSTTSHEGGSSDTAGRMRTNTEKESDDQKKSRRHKYAFHTRSEVDVLDDGYRWRKYGQKNG